MYFFRDNYLLDPGISDFLFGGTGLYLADFEEKKVFVKLVICVIITGIIALISNYTTALVTSPYVTSTRNSLMEGILNNPYQGIVEMIRLFFQNIETMNPVKLVDLASRSHGIYACFFAVYWIMLAVFLLKIRKEGKKTSFYSVVGFYFLIGFLGGYCALYTGEAATLCRGLNTGIVFMLFFLLAEERQIGVEIFVFFDAILRYFQLGILHGPYRRKKSGICTVGRLYFKRTRKNQ